MTPEDDRRERGDQETDREDTLDPLVSGEIPRASRPFWAGRVLRSTVLGTTGVRSWS